MYTILNIFTTLESINPNGFIVLYQSAKCPLIQLVGSRFRISLVQIFIFCHNMVRFKIFICYTF